ncbi:molybdenum cofactor biosynthesis protein MoaE [Candidatus Micrarchaeota archaeon]|nr:molybdenum cofactor biosynthesis protein MoaE [Candidatus Micrarchaeota archaeon]
MPNRSLDELISAVKGSPNISSAGMLLCHNGFVRSTSRIEGKPVAELEVQVDHEKVAEIREWALGLPGVVAVEIEPFEGKFKVGDDLLYIVVAGDIRENVFEAMRSTIERVKAEAVSKKEY